MNYPSRYLVDSNPRGARGPSLRIAMRGTLLSGQQNSLFYQRSWYRIGFSTIRLDWTKLCKSAVAGVVCANQSVWVDFSRVRFLSNVGL